MGGLVSRSYVQGIAVHPETEAPEPYRDDVRKIIFIATPGSAAFNLPSIEHTA
ncbi:MAG TPA: hypothetical protein VLK65_21405 [Vicinamibacteria bacterium]|nr:hypothetical protein [Vicinamibacteria bacterium]